MSNPVTQLPYVAAQLMSEVVSNQEKRVASFSKGDLDQIYKGIYHKDDYRAYLQKGGKACEGRLADFFQLNYFIDGYVNPDFFENVPAPLSITKKSFNHFKIKEKVSASQAIKALHSGLTLIDCGNVIAIVYLVAIKNLFGAEKFNALFGASGPSPLEICWNEDNHGTFGLFIQATQVTNATEYAQKVHIGDIVWVTNTSVYKDKHPGGNGTGVYLIQMAGDKFFGFDLPAEGATLAKVQDILLDVFNSPQTSLLKCTPEQLDELRKNNPGRLEKAEALKNKTFTIETFKQTGGGALGSLITSIHLERIGALYEASIPDAIELLKSWK